MGQQQLILLVLATVIIGIAIVVGIRAFTENDAKANADAMMQDAVRMANDVQAWVKKPQPFGGAGTASMSTATFGTIGYAVGDQPGGATAGTTQYENVNGIFSIAASGTTGILLTGTSYIDGTTTTSTAAEENVVQVVVCGTTDSDINGAIIKLNRGTAGTAPTACS